MCHTNLDLRRDAIDRRWRTHWDVPVLYVTQVVGLALGLDERSLGLHRHHVPVRLSAPSAPVAPAAVGGS